MTEAVGHETCRALADVAGWCNLAAPLINEVKSRVALEAAVSYAAALSISPYNQSESQVSWARTTPTLAKQRNKDQAGCRIPTSSKPFYLTPVVA